MTVIVILLWNFFHKINDKRNYIINETELGQI